MHLPPKPEAYRATHFESFATGAVTSAYSVHVVLENFFAPESNAGESNDYSPRHDQRQRRRQRQA